MGSSRAPSRTSFALSSRQPSEAGVEPHFHSARASPAAEGAIVFEVSCDARVRRSPATDADKRIWVRQGPLFVPPPGSLSASEALALPVSEWEERYLVLTDAALEVRPTDRGGPRAVEMLLTVGECTKVTNVDRPGVGLRAFSVHLASGGSQLFATDTRTKRANWVLAFGQVAAVLEEA